MQDPESFENFIRGIPTDMPPFAITEITKLCDTSFDVFLDIKPEHRTQAGFQENEEGEHDFRILVSYFPPASTLSMGVLVETGITPSAYGWTLDCLNAINMFGNGYVSKVFLPTPEPGDEKVLNLVIGWEVGLYEPSLLEGEGLKALTMLIHGIMLRLCVETSSLTVELTKMFNEEFPSGKLDA